jgi:hypothetical protein
MELWCDWETRSVNRFIASKKSVVLGSHDEIKNRIRIVVSLFYTCNPDSWNNSPQFLDDTPTGFC